jgi:hypothetical protein
MVIRPSLFHAASLLRNIDEANISVSSGNTSCMRSSRLSARTGKKRASCRCEPHVVACLHTLSGASGVKSPCCIFASPHRFLRKSMGAVRRDSALRSCRFSVYDGRMRLPDICSVARAGLLDVGGMPRSRKSARVPPHRSYNTRQTEEEAAESPVGSCFP